jgi:succinoglycan biosynthesis protein ExoM
MKNKVYFCICTKNRKLQLVKNFTSILSLKNFSKYNVEVVLVSNDFSSYGEFLTRFRNKLKINFYREVKSGVVYPRNKILKILRKKKFDYAAFIDDDCIFDKNWLTSMVDTIRENTVDVVTGPQKSLSSNFLLKVMDRNHPHGSNVRWASTNNVFFKSNVIKNNINFNVKLNKTGGEDQLFFNELSKSGKLFFWNSRAIVYELKNNKRENFKWFYKRNLRYGASSIIIYRNLYGNFFGNFIIVIKLVKDFFELIKSLFKIFIDKKYLILSLMYTIRILGTLMGFFGYQIREY